MSRKLKFKPVITRVKLNPEQAVLACACHTGGGSGSGFQETDQWVHTSQLWTCTGPAYKHMNWAGHTRVYQAGAFQSEPWFAGGGPAYSPVIPSGVAGS